MELLHRLGQVFRFEQCGSVTALHPNGASVAEAFKALGCADSGDIGFVNLVWPLVRDGFLSPALRLYPPSDYILMHPDFWVAINHKTAKESVEETAFDASGWCILRIRLEGELSETFDDKGRQIEKTDCSFLHFASDTSYTCSVARKNPLSGVSILFRPEAIARKFHPERRDFIDRVLTTDSRDSTHCLPFAPNARIPQLVNDMLELSADEPMYPMLVEAMSWELLAQAFLSLPEVAGEIADAVKLSDSDVRQLVFVKEHIAANFSDSHTLEVLCRLAGLNRRKLIYGFKSLFGRTVSEYVLLQRMERACEFLKSGQSVSSTADLVGYEELSSFSRAFKRHFGVSPKDYRSDTMVHPS